MSDYRDRLIAAREQLSLSRAAMAKRLLTPRQTYEQWEEGTRRTPGIAAVAAEAIIAARGDPTYERLVQQAANLSRGGASRSVIALNLGISQGLVSNMIARGEIPRTTAKPTGAGYRFGPEDHKRADAMLIGGATITATAEALGCSNSLIHKWISKGLIPPSRYRQGDTHGLDPSAIDRVRDVLARGGDPTEAANAAGVAPNTVHAWLRRGRIAGIAHPRRRRQKRVFTMSESK